MFEEQAVRVAAFQFLESLTRLHGHVLNGKLLTHGFEYRDERICIASLIKGIFKPRQLQWPLSVVTVPIEEGRPRPYDDEVGADGFIRYRYRGTDPTHPDNVGLRTLMQRQLPLIYLHGVAEGRYHPVWPVYIVHDDPSLTTFTLAIDAHAAFHGAWPGEAAPEMDSRKYATRVVTQRMHQESFRFRVLNAYEGRCCICSLRHRELLDAAHILPDTHPRGEPWVSNGLSLCKLHHAAYDANILGVRPDLKVEVRHDILEELDGPMLVHGVQEFNQRPLMVVPRTRRDRPNPEFLEERYELFRHAG